MVFQLSAMLPLTNENGLARTPPLGWRSWNLYGANVSQTLIESIMDGMVRRDCTVDGVPGGARTAVLLMNNGNTAADLALAFKDIPGVRCTRCHVRDIWAKRDLGDFDGGFVPGFVAKAVAAHARRAFPRAHAGRRGEWCLANRQSQSYR